MIVRRRSADAPEAVETPEEDAVVTDLEPYVRGALRLVSRPDGLVVPQRFGAKQSRYLEDVGRGKRARATSGVVLDLLTTGDEVSFDCEVLRHLDRTHDVYEQVIAATGGIDRADGGIVDGIDVVVDGSATYTVAPETGRVRVEFENPWHREVEVRVYLPVIMSVAVGNLSTNGSIAPAPARGYLLALGDSITQGWVVGCPSLSYPARVARRLGLDLLNQGVAGYVFDERSLKGLGHLRENPPQAITVAYGTNDWKRVPTAKQLKANARAYFDRLAKLFPGVPTYVLTPLWRADEAEKTPCGKPLSWAHEAIVKAAKPYGWMRVVRGYDVLPHRAALMADGVVHPSSTGAAIVADALVEAMGGHAGGEVAPSAASQPLEPALAAPDETPADAVDRVTRKRAGAPAEHPEFDRLVRTIWRLRQPDGCPWDKAQTHESITKNMVEEAYEAVDAIHDEDVPHMQEEFGDVLEQVLLHSQIASDAGEFDIDDVCRSLNEKLVRRHPHVFGTDGTAESADAALDIWDSVKKVERANAPEERGLLDSVPRSLPALMQCQKVSKRAAKVGFEWASEDDVWAQVESERQEFLAERPGSEARAQEFGDVLFSLVNVARWEGIDAEEALDASVRKFRKRWKRMERAAKQEGRAIDSYTTAELNELWERAKKKE